MISIYVLFSLSLHDRATASIEYPRMFSPVSGGCLCSAIRKRLSSSYDARQLPPCLWSSSRISVFFLVSGGSNLIHKVCRACETKGKVCFEQQIRALNFLQFIPTCRRSENRIFLKSLCCCSESKYYILEYL